MGVSLDYFGPLRSELKQKILLSLLKGERKLAEIRADVGVRETSILHVIKEFESLNITEKSGGTYKLTSLGFIEAQLTKEYCSAIETVQNFKDFWLSHETNAIPLPLMLRIGALNDSVLVKAGSSELAKVHEAFLQILLSSKKVKGISPIFHPDYVRVFEKLLIEGNSVELVLTNAVLTKTLASAEMGAMQKYLKEGNLKIFVNENAKIALTVTEKSFSLGLFSLNGEYDYNADLESESSEAIAWGEELFQNILRESVMIGGDSSAEG